MIGTYCGFNLRREVFGVNVPSENRRWPRGRDRPKIEMRGRDEMIVCRLTITTGLAEQSSAERRAGSPEGCLHKGVVSTEDRFHRRPLP